MKPQILILLIFAILLLLACENTGSDRPKSDDPFVQEVYVDDRPSYDVLAVELTDQLKSGRGTLRIYDGQFEFGLQYISPARDGTTIRLEVYDKMLLLPVDGLMLNPPRPNPFLSNIYIPATLFVTRETPLLITYSEQLGGWRVRQ